jgi:hypothetical protein
MTAYVSKILQSFQHTTRLSLKALGNRGSSDGSRGSAPISRAMLWPEGSDQVTPRSRLRAPQAPQITLP